MKTFLSDIPGGGYTFNPALRTVTLTGLDVLALNQVLMVLDTTLGVVLYNPSSPAIGGVLAANVLTLTLNTVTGGFLATDKLLVVLDHSLVTGQVIDTGNTKVITAADASPGVPWIGAASRTRDLGIVGILLSVICPTAAIGGTYTFEFSEDGLTWPISIPVTVADFSTIRFRQLLNVGKYYRAKFEPTTPLGANIVVLTSQFARQDDPAFIVPAGHVFEEGDAAFDQTFSFLKAFQENGRSKNIRCDSVGGLHIAAAKKATYMAAARTATVPNTLTIALTAVTTVQAVTIHHLAGAVKTTRLRKVEFLVGAISASANVTMDLIRITGTPLLGTLITPIKMESTDPAAECVVRALPATPGTEAGVLVSRSFELVASDKNLSVIVYEMTAISPEKAPTLLAGAAEGFAIICRADGAVTINGIINLTFLEE